MKINSKDSFKSLKTLKVDNKNYNIFSLKEAEKNGLEGISKLPKSIKVLLENLLRFEDNKSCLLYKSPSPRDATLSRMACYA